MQECPLISIIVPVYNVEQYLKRCVDSDDYVDLTMFEILIKTSMEHDADIVSCNYFLSKGQSVKEALSTNDFILYNPDCFENIVLENEQARVSRSLCNKLFRKKLFDEHHIRMCAGYVYAEDFAISYKLVFYANKVVYTSQPLYYYMIRESSLVTSGFSKDKLVVLKVIDEYERMVKEHFPQLLKNSGYITYA